MWQASSQGETFELTGNDRQSADLFEFENGIVEFHFSRKTGGDDPVTAHIKITDPVAYREVTEQSVTIEPDTTQKVFISVSGFGWRDNEMTVPIAECGYEVWLEGAEDAEIDVEVWS